MELTPRDTQDTSRGDASADDSTAGPEALVPGHTRPRLSIEVTHTSRAAVIKLAGELDMVCADTFKRRFADARQGDSDHLVIDIRELTFLDSTGLALLLRVSELAGEEEFALWIVSPEAEGPNRIFRMTGTHTILPLVETMPDFGIEAAHRTDD
jgi:anti-anti-sigma factor